MSTESHDLQINPSSSRIDGYTQQYIEGLAGVERRILCAPTAFYQLAQEMGYNIPLPEYVDMIKKQLDSCVRDEGWNRARLCQNLREGWGVSSVSCWTKTLGTLLSSESIGNMQKAGYLSDSPLEVAFLKEVMSTVSEGSRGVMDLIKKGIPVVTTVEPGFADNQAKHAVVLESLDDVTKCITVFDPDERNSSSIYTIDWVEHYLSADGATTVLFPSPGIDQYMH